MRGIKLENVARLASILINRTLNRTRCVISEAEWPEDSSNADKRACKGATWDDRMPGSRSPKSLWAARSA